MNYHDAIYSADCLKEDDLTWKDFSESFEDSLRELERTINNISYLREVCRDALLEATECRLGEATAAAFAISEPHWASGEDTKKLRDLRKRLHDLYLDSKPVH